MTPKPLARFWKTLDEIPEANDRRDWSLRLKEDWPAAKSYLTPLGVRAKEIACPSLGGDGCPRKVDPLYADERTALEAYADLLEQQTEAKAKRKVAQEDLDQKIDAKYPKLAEAEIKTLVVDDKWMARLSAAVQGELDRVSQTLTGRIRQLAERYATPLPKLTDQVETLSARVEAHLKTMGVLWK
jgi:hypothetical protein